MRTALKTAWSGTARLAFSLALAALVATLAGCGGTGGLQRRDGLSLPRDGRDTAALQASRAAAPTEPYWPYRLALTAAAAGDTRLATAHLDTALVIDMDYAPAIALRAKLQFDAGEHEAAVTALDAFLARHPAAPDELRVALSLHLQALGEVEQAEAALAACTDQSGPVRTAHASAVLKGDGFLTSLPAAEAAVSDDPESAANQNNLGISLLYAGRADEARTAFDRALELDPALPGALYNLAIVETYYFYDPAAGRDYFRRYREVAGSDHPADPDDLATRLDVSGPPGEAQAALAPGDPGGAHD